MVNEAEEPAASSDDQGATGRAPNGLVRTVTSRKPASFAPPSAILDGSQPIVELEADRLNEAMSWLYAAVRSLQQQDAAMGSHLLRLDGTVQERLSADGLTVATAAQEPPARSAAPSPTGAAAIAEGPVAQSSNDGDGDAALATGSDGADSVEARLSRVEQQSARLARVQEHRSVAEETLLEMRLSSLKCEIDSRLLPKDLEELKRSLAEKLDQFESKAKEDVGLLGSMLNTEGAGDRRRLQAQFESLNSKVSSQIELAVQMNQSNIQKNGDFLNQLEQQQRGLAERVEELMPAFDGIEDLDQRLRALEGPNAPPPRDPMPKGSASGGAGSPTSGSQQNWKQDIQRRLESLELSGGGGSGAGEALNSQFLDFHKQHNTTHLRLLEANRRLSNLEEANGIEPEGEEIGDGEVLSRELDIPEIPMAGLDEPVGCGAPIAGEQQAEPPIAQKKEKKDKLPATPQSKAGEGGGIKERMSKMENVVKDMHDDVDYMEKRVMQADKGNKEQVKFMLRTLETLTKFVSGVDGDASPRAASARKDSIDGGTGSLDHEGEEKSAGEAGVEGTTYSRSSSPGSPGVRKNSAEDALAWLERRVHKMMRNRHKGLSLEARIVQIEIDAQVGGGMDFRLGKMESEIKILDVPSLRQVRPDLVEYRQEYEVFEDSLRRDMKEVKCLVGCLEACIPRETRKAVDLFKRAAGASEHSLVPTSPQEFEVEGKILILRDDMETRLNTAEAAIKDQCEHVVQIVRNMEKRQDRLAGELAKVGEGGGKSPPSRELQRALPAESAARPGSVAGAQGAPPGWARAAT